MGNPKIREIWIVCVFTLCGLAGCTGQHSADRTAVDGARPGTGPARSVEHPPAAGPATVPGREYGSVTSMFDVIPETIRPGPSGEWTRLKIDAANSVLAREVLGHRARIGGRVGAVGVASGRFNRRYAGLPRARLGQPAIGEIPVTLYAYFPAGSKEQIAAINTGENIVASGTVSRAELTEEPNGHGVRLNVDLMDCLVGR